MGAVSFSLDLKIIEYLKRALPLKVFVETGTLEGKTAQRVAPYFEEVHTVELAEEYYLRACEQLKGQPSVRVYHDSSERFLQALRPYLESRSVLYWLDAHWCSAEATAGFDCQCPLPQELSAIDHLNRDSVILIDDARLFLCPPPRPHRTPDWPIFHAIVSKLLSLSRDHEIMVVNDIIIFYPDRVRSLLVDFSAQHGIDWLTVLDKGRDYDSLLSQLQEKDALIQRLDVMARTLAAEARQGGMLRSIGMLVRRLAGTRRHHRAA